MAGASPKGYGGSNRIIGGVLPRSDEADDTPLLLPEALFRSIGHDISGQRRLDQTRWLSTLGARLLA
eukprot:3797643-Pyramimonas_sp.AAC.1